MSRQGGSVLLPQRVTSNTAVRLGRSFPLPVGFKGAAEFSEDGAYRWWLSRTWDERKPWLITIATNPSSAGAAVDDGTIRVLEGLAARAGFGQLKMLNAYALVSTERRALQEAQDPIGERTDDLIRATLAGTTTRDGVLCAWGAITPARHQALRSMVFGAAACRARAYCLGTLHSGYPRHPLRTKLQLLPYA